MYTPDLFLEADFSACFAVISTSSILSGNRFLVICWSVKLKVMTTLSLYKITSRIKFLIDALSTEDKKAFAKALLLCAVEYYKGQNEKDDKKN